jgi:phage baseplate assembly protein W
MSTLAKDLDPDIFIGISLPLVHSTQGFFNKTKTTLEQTRSNIKNLLLTVKGERLGNPTFGCDLMRILFEPDAGDLGDRIEETIRASISEWLPYVRIKSIKTTSSERNPNLINVKLQFTLDVDQNVETLDLDLTAGGGG